MITRSFVWYALSYALLFLYPPARICATRVHGCCWNSYAWIDHLVRPENNLLPYNSEDNLREPSDSATRQLQERISDLQNPTACDPAWLGIDLALTRHGIIGGTYPCQLSPLLPRLVAPNLPQNRMYISVPCLMLIGINFDAQAAPFVLHLANLLVPTWFPHQLVLTLLFHNSRPFPNQIRLAGLLIGPIIYESDMCFLFLVSSWCSGFVCNSYECNLVQFNSLWEKVKMSHILHWMFPYFKDCTTHEWEKIDCFISKKWNWKNWESLEGRSVAPPKLPKVWGLLPPPVCGGGRGLLPKWVNMSKRYQTIEYYRKMLASIQNSQSWFHRGGTTRYRAF